ncbi:response regulator [Desulfovibrio gilichinskyi]|uniref:Sensory/regulatory protein RpfC n=1 Tax=Desulfovibrio gilichinskyi TaxID=1519643 RepID=A0A1X7E7Y6_9BACT|nr:response regulator [Desulfovibrio gilichinskyi]SMF28882.1 PAS domain S-box-containing protein [Desulfovibrio gilichinskyi]
MLKSILVIDDQQENLFILEEMLNEFLPSIKVITALGAQEGMQKLGQDVGVVISDVQMPSKNGIELCKSIKDNPEYKDISILLITAHQSTPSMRVQAMKAGALDFISRPIDTNELVAKVNVALKVHYKEHGLRHERDELSTKVEVTGQKLKAADRQYKTLFDNANDAIFILDTDGDILEANPEAHAILGYNHNVLVGRSVKEILNKHDAGLLLSSIALTGEVNISSEFVVFDRTRIPIEIRSRLVELSENKVILAIARDVTRQKMAEQVIKESEKHFRLLYTDAPVAYQSLNGFGEFLDVNLRFTETLGYTAKDVVGKPFVSILHPDCRGDFANQFSKISSISELKGLELRILKKNSEEVLVAFNARVASSGVGTFQQVHCVFHDITKERNTEKAIIKAKEAAEKASRSKSEFLANMSHEIRTPLNGIMGMMQLLQSSDLKNEQIRYVTMAIQSSRRLTSLLSDILDLSRVEAGKMNISYEKFELTDILHQLSEMYCAVASQSGVELILSIDPNVPHYVIGDSVRLQQVLTNLLGNSLKFTTEGKITVEAYKLPISKENMVKILFSVSDTGVGIPEGKIQDLFVPFSQASEGYTRKYQGAGLGLSICKRLVNMMGGGMSLESEEGNGTTVHFTALFGGVDQDYIPSPAEVQTEIIRQDPMRILLVEDEFISRLSAQKQIENLDCHVVAVENGLQALESLQSGSFDVVFMDIQMPTMDGIEATKAIRQGLAGVKNRDVYIIAMTAYAMEGDKNIFLGSSMDDYLAKPVEIVDLEATLNRARNKLAQGI